MTIGCDDLRFGDILRELLEDHELSQKQFAQALNISAGAMGNYVRSNREPDFDTLKEIAGFFHVSIDFLLDYHGESDSDYRDEKLLQIFHALTEEQRDLYLEQGRVFVRSNSRKRGGSLPFGTGNKAI